MQKYEYRIVEYTHLLDLKGLVKGLNELGSEGWEHYETLLVNDKLQLFLKQKKSGDPIFTGHVVRKGRN